MFAYFLHIGEQLYKLFQEYIRALDSNKLRPSAERINEENVLVEIYVKFFSVQNHNICHSPLVERGEKLEISWNRLCFRVRFDIGYGRIINTMQESALNELSVNV